MALCFGGDWREEDEYDDSPIGISSSMKEYVRDMDYWEQENTTMTNEKFNRVTTEFCGFSIGESLIDGEYNTPAILNDGKMAEKFTPGEWTVHEFYHEFSKQNLYNIYWSKDGEEVAERIYTKSDAHLMAASKDLYECVCDALTDLEMPEGMRNHFESVLKKARGEE